MRTSGTEFAGCSRDGTMGRQWTFQSHNTCVRQLALAVVGAGVLAAQVPADEDAGPAERELPPYALIKAPPVLPGDTARLNAINNDAIAVGSGFGSSGWDSLPLVVSSTGEASGLPLPPDFDSATLWHINVHGEILGRKMDSSPPDVLWDTSGVPLVLPSHEAWTTAVGLNDMGTVIRYYYADPGSNRLRQPATWSAETGMVALPDLEPDAIVTSAPVDINNDGIIVGYSATLESLPLAVKWQDGEIVPLLWPGGRAEVAEAINDAGVIAGIGITGCGSSLILWYPDGRVIEAPDSYGECAGIMVSDINERGFVLARKTNFESRPLLWFDHERLPVEVEQLLPPRSGWRDLYMHDLNDHNQMTGWGKFADASTWFTLTPVYPTLTLGAITPGRAGEVNSIAISDAPPNATVTLYFGRSGGGAYISGCSILQNALQILEPRFGGRVVTDANGEGSIEGVLPLVLKNQMMLFQAVAADTCEISNLIVQTIE